MGLGGLLRHSFERRVTTEGSLDPEGADYGHGAPSTATVGAAYRGLVQPRGARERISIGETGASIGEYRIYLERSAIGIVDVDDVLRKIGTIDADLNGDYRIRFLGNAAGMGHHLEVGADRIVA